MKAYLTIFLLMLPHLIDGKAHGGGARRPADTKEKGPAMDSKSYMEQEYIKYELKPDPKKVNVKTEANGSLKIVIISLLVVNVVLLALAINYFKNKRAQNGDDDYHSIKSESLDNSFSVARV